MKYDFRFQQERDSSKKQNKQEVIEYILNQEYGTTLTNEDLGKRLGYNIDNEEEFKKYKSMMQSIKRALTYWGRVLRSVSNVGYYILKPSQISGYCYRTYITGASRLYDKSEYILQRTDKTELTNDRQEEIANMTALTQKLIEESMQVIQESPYYSRKSYYDNLEE